MIYQLNFYVFLMVIGVISHSEKTVGLSDQQRDAMVIAFGSCSHEYDEQPMWDEVLKQKPDVWVWLGDNIYGDTPDMDTLKHKYQIQLNNPSYENFIKNTAVIGIWDDHDYGINDGGKGYVQKAQSQQLFLDFMGEPASSKRRQQEGIYTSYLKEKGNLTVKIILLDTRYHRDTLSKNKGGYLPSESGDILGKKQWRWLEKELKNSNADIHIIASSIQVVPEEHRYEKWANFPRARQRLFNLISKSNAKGVFFISGDRHIAEFSKIEFSGMDYPLYDLTSSGLTHTWRQPAKEKNQYRVGPLIAKLNYGVLHIRKEEGSTVVDASVRGLSDTPYFEKSLEFKHP